jgi:hypothetical protein
LYIADMLRRLNARLLRIIEHLRQIDEHLKISRQP